MLISAIFQEPKVDRISLLPAAGQKVLGMCEYVHDNNSINICVKGW